jgi:hypothetical protein
VADFALPILPHGEFCVSALFMDPRNEAIWLTNDERYDGVKRQPSHEDSFSIDSSLVNTYLQVGTKNPTFHRTLQFCSNGSAERSKALRTFRSNPRKAAWQAEAKQTLIHY